MARISDFRVVLDTNVLVRGLANRASASGRLLRLCESREVLMLLSRRVVREYRDVLGRAELTDRHPAITARVVNLVIERLRYSSDDIDPIRARFRYDRDPDDECLIELAISGQASHLITYDADLLSLPNDPLDAGKRFRQRLPGIWVVESEQFLAEVEAAGRES